MRLLECHDGKFKLTRDLARDIPKYAILSHTWGLDGEEVTFGDLVDGTGKEKTGFEKIRFCAEQARRHGLRYFWVDTCCIKKSDSAELSKAINSMFRWYQNAARCYVYLSDISASGYEEDSQQAELAWESAFRASKWFTRGWTLQELLAPASVEFFTKEGRWLGDKRSLEQHIHEITGIAIPALRGSALAQFDVEERFKWAQRRQTTHEEDWAYCLQGIFGIFIPPMYGEGKVHAVGRLKREIAQAMNRDDMPDHQEARKKTEDFLKKHSEDLQRICKRGKRNTKLICRGSDIIRKLVGRFRGMQKYGRVFKRLLDDVVTSNRAIYSEILQLRSCVAAFDSYLPPLVSEQPFIFEDACGHVAPIHLTYITTWEAFQAVLEISFKDRPGLEKIRRKEYSLQEEATGREIPQSTDIRLAILPGQKIVQDILFGEDRKKSTSTSSVICPYCRNRMESSESSDRRSSRCSSCKKHFRRIAEAGKRDFDMSHLPNPPPTWELPSQRQRSNDTDHCEITNFDLYCGFTRICIIARHNLLGEGQEHRPDGLVENHGRAIGEARSGRLLTCNNIWEKLQGYGEVQSGELDLDGLCSDLQKKAKCGGSGAIIEERDFDDIIRRHCGRL